MSKSEGSVRHEFLICINQTGTASSSPCIFTSSPAIINVMLWMKKEAYEDSIIKATAKRLEYLQKNCHLADPESIKIFANKKCSNAFKESPIETYDIYMRSIGQNWNRPFYARYDKFPKIPIEEKLNMLISHASPRMVLRSGLRALHYLMLEVPHMFLSRKTIFKKSQN